MPESDGFLAQLMARRGELETLEPVWQLIDDVLNSNVKQRTVDGWRSTYFPKGRLEPQSEYALRVELTPFFPQAPQVLASRLGALFKSRLKIAYATSPDNAASEGGSPPPRLTGATPDQPKHASGNTHSALTPVPETADETLAGATDSTGATNAARGAGDGGDGAAPNEPVSPFSLDELANDALMARFVKEAGRRHTSFEDLATQAACLSQSHGFCAALLDRDPLPADTASRAPSRAEAAARNLGRPYLALYAAPDVLDWDFGSDGRLAWVKFGEREMRRSSWDAPGVEELVYRIVDRSAIHVYRVRRGADGAWQAAEDAPLPHGFVDRVPVVFVHPFPGADGIGRPILRRAAESDVAAARVLSDLVWDLFVLGNPILTLKTGRRDEELARLGLGVTRYIPLRNGVPGQENAEDLSFVQLDPTGIELLFRAHALFAAQGLPGAHNVGPELVAGAAIPREQSGVAQAWRFKTGEERILFMLARALEPFLNDCLELAALALGIDGPPPVVQFPESFDLS